MGLGLLIEITWRGGREGGWQEGKKLTRGMIEVRDQLGGGRDMAGKEEEKKDSEGLKEAQEMTEMKETQIPG